VKSVVRQNQHDETVNPEFRTYLEAILADTSTKAEPKTRQEYTGNLDRMFRVINKPVEQVSYADIDAYLQTLKVGVGTMNNYKSAVKWFLNQAARVIHAADDVKAAKLQRMADRIELAASGDVAADQQHQKMTVSYEQFQTLLNAAGDEFHNLLLRLWWETIRRPGEVLQAKWVDVDFDQCKIRFPKTKTKALGWSAISPELAADLRAWKAKQANGTATIETRPGRNRPLAPSKYVLSYSGMEPMLTANAGRWLRNLAARVKLVAPEGQIFSPHCFRGSGAVYLRRIKHWYPEDIQRQGGWANTEQLVKAYFHDEVDERAALMRESPQPVQTAPAGPSSKDPAAIAELVKLGVINREEARKMLGVQ